MGKADEAGKAFLAGILAKLPESVRGKAEEAFADPGAAEALVVLGTGALAQSDINRKYDDIRAEQAKLTEDYNKLNAWYEQRQGELAEYAQIKPEYEKLKAGDPVLRAQPTAPALDPAKFIDRESFDKEMRGQQLAAANYLGLQNAITLKHLKDFNEVIDTRELLGDPNLGKQLADGRTYGLLDAYQTRYGDKIAEKAKADEDVRIQKLVDEKLAAERKTQPQPFPIRGAEPSVLDFLSPTAQTKPADFTVDSAVALYNDLQSQRG